MQQQFIDRALGEGATDGADVATVASAAVHAVERLLAELKPLVGGHGASALYQRSLHLATGLAARPSSTASDDFKIELEAMRENLAARDPADALRVARAILGRFVHVLCSLIGTPLTHRLLRTAWDIPDPDLPPKEGMT